MHLGDINERLLAVHAPPYFEQIRADFDWPFTDRVRLHPRRQRRWTDCHRAKQRRLLAGRPGVRTGDTRPAPGSTRSAGSSFPTPGWTLGQNPRRVGTQGGGYPENVTWTQADVQFGTIDVPGSNNDWLPWFEQRSDQLAGGRGPKPDRGRPRMAGPDLRRRARRACQGGRDRDPGRHVGPGDRGGPQPVRPFPADRAGDWRARRFVSTARCCCSTATRTSSSTTIRSPIRPGRRTSRSTASPATCRTSTAITVNGSTTPCHEWLKLTVDPHATGVFSYQRIPLSQAAGLRPALCPES